MHRGLWPLPAHAADGTEPGGPALACLLGALVDGPNVAFLHPDPDDPAMILFVIGFGDLRPELDLSVPAEQIRPSRCNGAEADRSVKIAGVQRTISRISRRGVDADDAIVASSGHEALAQARLEAGARRLFHAGHPARGCAYRFGGGGRMVGVAMVRRRNVKRARPPTGRSDRSCTAELARAIAAELFPAGASYARHLQRVVQQLPANAGGWRPASIDCKAQRCEIDYTVDGGTFDLFRRNGRCQDRRSGPRSRNRLDRAGRDACGEHVVVPLGATGDARPERDRVAGRRRRGRALRSVATRESFRAPLAHDFRRNITAWRRAHDARTARARRRGGCATTCCLRCRKAEMATAGHRHLLPDRRRA